MCQSFSPSNILSLHSHYRSLQACLTDSIPPLPEIMFSLSLSLSFPLSTFLSIRLRAFNMRGPNMALRWTSTPQGDLITFFSYFHKKAILFSSSQKPSQSPPAEANPAALLPQNDLVGSLRPFLFSLLQTDVREHVFAGLYPFQMAPGFLYSAILLTRAQWSHLRPKPSVYPTRTKEIDNTR